jgi:hypothetical protein
MKILAFSDIIKWDGYEKLVDKIQPDIIVLAGDLTSDGFAYFQWYDEFEKTPAFQKKAYKPIIFREEIKSGIVYTFQSRENYLKSKDFLNFRKKIHVDRFYQFLNYAGKKSKVLVIRGDHDNDFDGDYIPEKINKIHECKEIIGKVIKIGNLRFLGLGYNETYYLRILKPIIAEYKGKVDIVIMHGLRAPLISSLKPGLIIRGGIGPGKYLINDVPSVFTGGAKYTVIEFEMGKLPKILQYNIGLNDEPKLVKGSWPYSTKVSFKKYEWLKPYPSEM